MIDSQTIL